MKWREFNRYPVPTQKPWEALDPAKMLRYIADPYPRARVRCDCSAMENPGPGVRCAGSAMNGGVHGAPKIRYEIAPHAPFNAERFRY
jgi:hypothetical protein